MTIPEAQLTVDVLRGQRAMTCYDEHKVAFSSAITFLESWIATQEVIERAAKLGEAEAP